MKDFPPGCRAQGQAALESDPLERGWLSLGPLPTRSRLYSLAGVDVQVQPEAGNSPEALYLLWPRLTQERTQSLILVPGKSLWWGQGPTDPPAHLHGYTLPAGQCLYKRHPHLASHSHYPSSLPYLNTHNSSGTTEARIEYLAHCWVPRASIE